MYIVYLKSEPFTMGFKKRFFFGSYGTAFDDVEGIRDCAMEQESSDTSSYIIMMSSPLIPRIHRLKMPLRNT